MKMVYTSTSTNSSEIQSVRLCEVMEEKNRIKLERKGKDNMRFQQELKLTIPTI
jgi:hypothetical protein